MKVVLSHKGSTTGDIMYDFQSFVAMAPEEFIIHRGNGVVSSGSIVDSYRQPGVLGTYNRKPVFVYVNDRERDAMASGDIEAVFVMRGYKNTVVTNDPPILPNVTIPGNPNAR